MKVSDFINQFVEIPSTSLYSLKTIVFDPPYLFKLGTANAGTSLFLPKLNGEDVSIASITDVFTIVTGCTITSDIVANKLQITVTSITNSFGNVFVRFIDPDNGNIYDGILYVVAIAIEGIAPPPPVITYTLEITPSPINIIVDTLNANVNIENYITVKVKDSNGTYQDLLTTDIVVSIPGTTSKAAIDSKTIRVNILTLTATGTIIITSPIKFPLVSGSVVTNRILQTGTLSLLLGLTTQSVYLVSGVLSGDTENNIKLMQGTTLIPMAVDPKDISITLNSGDVSLKLISINGYYVILILSITQNSTVTFNYTPGGVNSVQLSFLYGGEIPV
jgi:hypothetical protein